jgi:hypothetical protein
MLGLALDDEVTSLGTTVECPPVCPGAQPPDTETAPVEEGGDIVLRYVHVLADYSVVPVTSTSTSSIGLYFSSRCITSGFADIPTDICLNASHPGHTLCPFGAGSSCRLCPYGALCPGGYRAWPLPGYYTVAEATGTVVKCPVPESRCNGWDTSTGTVRCGVGYRPGGYMCMSCENGFYASHEGTCARCPASVNMSGAVIVSMLTFLAYMLAGLGVLYGVCLAVLKVGGGSFLNVRSSFVSLIIWTFTTLQTVAQLGKLATHGMPSDLHSIYQALLVFQLEGASVPAACTGQDPLLMQLYSCVSILAVICTLTVIYAACALLPHVAALLRSWRFTTVVLRTLTLSLAVAAAPLSITLLQVLVCRIGRVPVHTYLGMLRDGRALQNAGIVLSALPTRAQLETLLEVPILMSDTSQVCYESTHALVYPLVLCTIVVYFVLYPILVSWVVSSTLDKLQPHTSVNGAAGHTRSFGGLCQRVMLCCCGRQLLERLRALFRARRWHCCIGSACTSDVYSNVDGADAKSQTQQDDMNAALRDPLLSSYMKAQYSPSFIWFMVIESWLQLLLATVGAGWKYTNGPMESGTKAAVLCAAMLGAAWLYETRQPYRVGRSWKTHVKALSLVVCSMGAIENALLSELPPGTDGTLNPVLAGWTYFLMAGTILLVVVLACVFMWSLFAEQKLELALFTRSRANTIFVSDHGRGLGTARRPSVHSTDNPMLSLQPQKHRLPSMTAHTPSPTAARVMRPSTASGALGSSGFNLHDNVKPAHAGISQSYMKRQNARVSVFAPAPQAVKTQLNSHDRTRGRNPLSNNTEPSLNTMQRPRQSIMEGVTENRSSLSGGKAT